MAFQSISQAKNKESGDLAALKQVDIHNEEDLDSFSVEINILAECKHQNVVGLYEAFFYDNKLWVSSLVEFCLLLFLLSVFLISTGAYIPSIKISLN